MFKKVTKFFKGEVPLQESLEVDKDGVATERDQHIAATVLLIEMASTDHDVAPEEAQAICSALARHFKLEDDELPELVNVAMAVREDTERIDPFVECINKNFNEIQRGHILVMLWSVVLADGHVDHYEKQFIDELQGRFSLSNTHAALAKKKAESLV